MLTTNTATYAVNDFKGKLHLKDIYSYRYLLAAIGIGLAYTILQIVFTIIRACTGNTILSGNGNLIFDFYGDKVVSYILATGAATGLGVSKDLKLVFVVLKFEDAVQFFNNGYASCSLLLIAFVYIAVSSVISSYALPRQV